MRSLMGKSSSKLGIAKGSMNHLGTTPYKYKVSLFISHVDGITTAGEVCVTMERHGKNEATSVVKVKDKKAVFRETLSMETTLFRRQTAGGKAGASPAEGEELKFDEKIAKIALRKGSVDGKSLGKIHLNLADYIKGPNGTIFADIKLSNDSVIVSKIESELLQMGKKKKNGEDESEAFSDTTERDRGMENDSIFGDNVEEKDDVDIMLSDMNATPQHAPPVGAARPLSRISPTNRNTDHALNAQMVDERHFQSMNNGDSGSPVPVMEDRPGIAAQSTVKLDAFLQRSEASASDASSSSAISIHTGPTASPSVRNVQITSSEPHRLAIEEPAVKARKDKEVDEKSAEGLASSPSLRHRIKARLKRDKTIKKDGEGNDANTSPTAVAESSFAASATEIAELRLALDAAQNENKKLKASKQALMSEIDELRAEIEANESNKAEVGRKGVEGMTTFGEGVRNSSGNLDLLRLNRELQDKVYKLETQLDDLRNESEEHSQMTGGGAGVSECDTDSMARVRTYERKIEDLEIALRREPQYLDVVDELKVTKMALALANMEREQAIFALKQHEATIAAHSNPPSAGWTLF
jgi:hypothetical protein